MWFHLLIQIIRTSTTYAFACSKNKSKEKKLKTKIVQSNPNRMENRSEEKIIANYCGRFTMIIIISANVTSCIKHHPWSSVSQSVCFLFCVTHTTFLMHVFPLHIYFEYHSLHVARLSSFFFSSLFSIC